jgi:SH3-like domain-containing protein
VALDQPTPLLAGPAIRSDTVAVIPAGTPVKVMGKEGNWLRLRTADQAEGWGNSERFAVVAPS